MPLPRRRLWRFLLALCVLVPVGYVGCTALLNYMWWDAFQRPVVRSSFKVALPDGSFVTFRNEAPGMRLAGPADSQKYLLWQRPNGQSQDYQIGFIGADYEDVEFRLRADGKALWLQTRDPDRMPADQRRIPATLDLQTGNFTDSTGTITQWGAPGPNESGPSGTPKWAKWNTGRSLGRKKF